MSLENQRVLDALERLSATLKDLPDNHSPDKLSHWRLDLPEGLETAFSMMEQGQSLVHATSTKYTLVTKIDLDEGSKLAKDLLRGCEALATGALVLHDDAVGCSRSLRKQVKHSVRAVVHTCISLLQVFVESPTNSQAAAARTGAIWDACEKISKLPNSNRNAMRRDLFTWIMECQDTMREFEELLSIQNNGDSGSTAEDTTWEMFTSGPSDEYAPEEQPIAVASLALIKCSRGSIKAALQACEAVGSHLSALADNPNQQQELLAWISKLHDVARTVGDGMTDLGSLLYPPLEMEELSDQVTTQCTAIVELHTMILDDPPECGQASWEAELVRLSTSIRTAAHARAKEAQAGITAALLV